MQPIAALQSQFDALALQVRAWAGKRERVISLGILGETSGVGTSTVALNLANAFAESSFSAPIALVHAETEKQAWKDKSLPGLVDLLTRGKNQTQCLTESFRENLKLMPFGQTSTPETRNLPWAELPFVVRHYFKAFGFVVFDLAAISKSAFSRFLAPQLDGLLIVSSPKRASQTELNELEIFLRDCPVEVLGRVINRSSEPKLNN